jgi:hypothetical protein
MRTRKSAKSYNPVAESTPIDCISSIPFREEKFGRMSQTHLNRSEAAHIIFPRKLLHLAAQLEFEERRKYFR